MSDPLSVLDLEIRIAATASVHAHLEVERMLKDRAGVTDLQSERRLRALVEELITLHARQVDGASSTHYRRPARSTPI